MNLYAPELENLDKQEMAVLTANWHMESPKTLPRSRETAIPTLFGCITSWGPRFPTGNKLAHHALP